MKLVLKIVSIAVFLSGGLLVVVVHDDQELAIESQESKTKTGGPVFNRIKWYQFKDRDIWMMNQSHQGPWVDSKEWDRLAIVVDKTKTPKTARFYQLEPGPLRWSDSLKEKSFKVSCFICHNNGPRAIRPNYETPFYEANLRDQLKILYWNLRIKAYGRIVASPIHDERDKFLFRPFRFQGSYENEPLKVETCVKCHQEDGPLARGSLRRQQVPTIKFMVESGHMPPRGFGLSREEKMELEKFLKGF